MVGAPDSIEMKWHVHSHSGAILFCGHWQRRKTEQSVKSSQDTACNKMGQSEWLVIDQHIHLPRPIFTFSCCRVIWIICMARAAQHCLSCLVQTDARENTGSDDQSGMCLFNSYHLTQIHKYTNTQIHKYTNTNKSDDQSGRDVTIQLLSTATNTFSFRKT